VSMFLDDGNAMAQRPENVGAVLATIVSGRAVVTDGEPSLHGEDSARGALGSVAAGTDGRLPDYLGEMAVRIQVRTLGRVWLVIERPVFHFVVVPLIGDATSSSLDLKIINVGGGAPTGKVLAVITIALGHVVGKNTAIGNGLGVCGKRVVPHEGRSRVVGTVNVVLVENN